MESAYFFVTVRSVTTSQSEEVFYRSHITKHDDIPFIFRQNNDIL